MHAEPVGPVAREFEEVLEVGQPRLFEVSDEVVHRIVLRDRTDAHQCPLDTELVRGEPKTLVDYRAAQPAALEGVLANDQGRMTGRDEERHTPL